MSDNVWYLQLFRSNFLAEPRIIRFNKELRDKPQFFDGLYNYLQLCMCAIESEDKTSVPYDLEELDIILGYDDERVTSGFINLLIKCRLAKIINEKLELYIAQSTILSKVRYEKKQEEKTKRREEYKKAKATPSKEVANTPDIDTIPF